VGSPDELGNLARIDHRGRGSIGRGL
jgi:hypothetical protein